MARDHYIAPTGEMLCGCDTFSAHALARNACTRCLRVVESLLYTINKLADLRGFCELYASDKRVARVIDSLPRLFGTDGDTIITPADLEKGALP